MKPATKCYVLLSLIILLAAACGPVTQVPLATATILPTLTPSPTRTAVPTLTPTRTPALAPTPTPFLPAAWSYAPPEGGPADYRLKPWTAGDYAFFIESLNGENLFNSYPTSLPVFYPFYGFEYLLHTEKLDSRDPALWRLAQMFPWGVSLPGMRQDEGYFNFLVEKMLNEEHVSIWKIRGPLKERGFPVGKGREVKDFYGKGQDAFFFDVYDDNGYLNIGAVFAIRRVNDLYQVDSVTDWNWMFGMGTGRDYSFEKTVDTNNNGFPELVMTDSEGHSGRPHIEKSTTWLYEWDEPTKSYRINSFPVFNQVCDEGACEGNWEVGKADSKGIPTVTVQEYYRTQTECPNLTVERTYHWDGKGYPLQQEAVLPPTSEKPECLVAWAEADIRLHDYGWQNDRAMQIISEAVDQWPATMDKDWGPASRDYFRLRLGIWKDLRGESDEAVRMLEPLADGPFVAEYPLASQTASAYLQGRRSMGMLDACHKANETWSAAIEKVFPNPWDASVEEARKFLGFASDLWEYGTHDFSTICPEDDALFATARNLTSTALVNPAAWFTSAGGTVDMVRQADFDRNGTQDWLVIGVTSEDARFPAAWFFFDAGDHFEVYETDETLGRRSPIVWRVLHVEEASDPIYLIQTVDSLWIFRVGQDRQVETLVEDYGMTLKLLQVDHSKGLKIKVAATDWDYKGEKIRDYVWDAASRSFVTVVEEYDFEGARQQAERLIFQEHHYAWAIALVQQFLAEAPTEYLTTEYCELDVCYYHPQRYYPHMYYLMALAYEMSGQPEQAARTYYILWRDYPESPYGLLAQYKLERVN